MKIVLIGFATTYKSTVGELLSQKLSLPLFDTDKLIELKERKKIFEIFAEKGEQYFRAKENEMCLSMSEVKSGVVATGGGIVMAENFKYLASGAIVVHLTATPDVIKSRLTDGRPLFDKLSLDELTRLVKAREPLYKKFATLTIDTTAKTSEETTSEVLKALERLN